MLCPHCHQNAPIVYRGVFAFGAACNQPRAPFSAKALNFAGQPSKLGGRVGRALGFLVLFFGLLSSAALILFLQLLWPAAHYGYAFGLPLALISFVIGALVLFQSGRLQRSGADAERQARVEAMYALAVNRGGTLTAADAARSLELDVDRVDALLGDLARTEPSHVSLEFDADGRTFYIFSHAGTRPHPFGAKYRVNNQGRVRVSDVLGVNGPRETLTERDEPERDERDERDAKASANGKAERDGEAREPSERGHWTKK
jgi:hypothetical protein